MNIILQQSLAWRMVIRTLRPVWDRFCIGYALGLFLERSHFHGAVVNAWGLRQGEGRLLRSAQEIQERRWPMWPMKKKGPDTQRHTEENRRLAFHPMISSS